MATHPGGLINDHQAGRALRLFLRHLGVLTLGRLILLVGVSLTSVLGTLSCSSQGGVALASLTQKRLNVEGVLGNLVSDESQGGGQAGSDVLTNLGAQNALSGFQRLSWCLRRPLRSRTRCSTGLRAAGRWSRGHR